MSTEFSDSDLAELNDTFMKTLKEAQDSSGDMLASIFLHIHALAEQEFAAQGHTMKFMSLDVNNVNRKDGLKYLESVTIEYKVQGEEPNPFRLTYKAVRVCPPEDTSNKYDLVKETFQ